MKKIHILFAPQSLGQHNAWSKAPRDVTAILKRNGYETLRIMTSDKFPFIVKQLYNLWKISLAFLKIKSGSTCFIQYPFDAYIKYVLFLLKKNDIRTQILIHDIHSCRFHGELSSKEYKIFDSFDKIIVHTKAMKTLLVKHGISVDKIEVLYLFDYLVASNSILKDEDYFSICFAGNLKKSMFLKKMNQLKNVYTKYYLYGNFDTELVESESFIYGGRFDPDNISNIKGKWGLVWDGDGLNKCSGSMGEYLKINASHKASLYLASQKPLIVWNQSALANFVEDNKLGITIDSLEDIEKELLELSEQQMDEIECNVLHFAKKITSGDMLSSILKNINWNAGSTSNRSNWSTIMSYLKSHASYLGLKQDRFTILLPSGLPDYTIDIVNGEQVKKVKVNRPKALCFDYLQLKETFGLDLETEVVAENQEEIPTESNAIDLQQFKQNELPFE